MKFTLAIGNYIQLINLKVLCSQKDVLKVLPALFCSYVPEDSFPADLIQQFLKQSEVHSS